MGRIQILMGSPKIRKTSRLLEEIIHQSKGAIFAADKSVDRFRLFYDKTVVKPKGMRIRGKRLDLSQKLITNDVRDLVKYGPQVVLISDFPPLATWDDRSLDVLKKVSIISNVLKADLLIEVTTSDDAKTHEAGARMSAALEKSSVPFEYEFVLGLKHVAVLTKFFSEDLIGRSEMPAISGLPELALQ